MTAVVPFFPENPKPPNLCQKVSENPKQPIHLSISNSLKPVIRPSTRQNHLWSQRAYFTNGDRTLLMEPKAGARKKHPVGTTVYLLNEYSRSQNQEKVK